MFVISKIFQPSLIFVGKDRAYHTDVLVIIIIINVVCDKEDLHAECCYAECRYAECSLC